MSGFPFRKIHPLFFILLFFCSTLLCYEIAVVPYRAESSGINEVDAGEEYGKIIGLVARVKYGDRLYSSVQVARDMREFRIDPSSTITADDLMTIGKKRYMDYILTGTVFKGEGGYSASSLLFSPSKGRVISRSKVSAKTLYALAERDMEELYNYHVPQQKRLAASTADFVLLIDSSYYNADELASVKDSVLFIADRLYNSMPGSRICIITFSEKRQHVAHEWCGGIAKVHSVLSEIKAYGRGTDEGLAQAMRFIARDLRFKADNRCLWIYTNTPLAAGKLVTEAREIAAKKLELVIVAGARISPSGTGYGSVAESARGSVHYAAYHQVFTDHMQTEHHLFFEKGKVYVSAAKQNWREGVKQLKLRTIEKESALPSHLGAIAREQGYTVMGSSALETNIVEITGARYETHKFLAKSSLTLARVLLGYEGTSVWCDITNRKDLEFFRRQQNSGFSFFLGLRVKEDPNSPFGSTIIPDYFYDIEPEAVPAVLRASLKTILGNPKKYAREGFLSPPLWFANVTVLEIRELKAENDIR